MLNGEAFLMNESPKNKKSLRSTGKKVNGKNGTRTDTNGSCPYFKNKYKSFQKSMGTYEKFDILQVGSTHFQKKIGMNRKPRREHPQKLVDKPECY